MRKLKRQKSVLIENSAVHKLRNFSVVPFQSIYHNDKSDFA